MLRSSGACTLVVLVYYRHIAPLEQIERIEIYDR